jgi:hypothetical protein
MEMKPTDVCTAGGYYFFATLYECEKKKLKAKVKSVYVSVSALGTAASVLHSR